MTDKLITAVMNERNLDGVGASDTYVHGSKDLAVNPKAKV